MKTDLEVTYILRVLRKNLAFSSLCMLVIALGIGLSVTMYSVVSDLAFKPLPFPGGDRFVTVKAVDKDTQNMTGIGGIDAYLFSYLRDNSTSYASIGGFTFTRATLSDGEVAEQFVAAEVSADLMPATAVAPLLGRILTAEDAQINSEPVAVIGEKIWRNYYASAQDVIGRSTRINGKMHTIVGVMPASFKFPVNHDLWLPLQIQPNVKPGEGSITPVGLLKPGVDVAAANAEAERLAAQAAADYPGQYGNRQLAVVSYTRMFVANIMGSVYLLIGATFAVLLLVSMNMGNLLLIRANELSQEIAVRSAMGAGQLAIIKRVLFEFLVICLAGTLLGLVLAQLGMQLVQKSVALVAGNADNIPFWMSWDWRGETILSAVIFALLLWIFSGVGPALSVSKADPGAILAGGSKGSMASGNGRVTKILVGAEVVFSFFLLTVCGAFIAGISSASNTDFGTRTTGITTASVELSGDRYASVEQRIHYLRALEQELMNRPEVKSVAFTSALPSQSGQYVPFNLADRDLMVNGSYASQGQVWISEQYFDNMNVTLLEGRGFSSLDRTDSAPVVIVDEIFSRRMWPAESAVGKRVQINAGQAGAEWLTIVGVSSHVLQAPPLAGQRLDSTFYRPLTQASPAGIKVVAEARDPGTNLGFILKSAALNVDRDIPLADVEPLLEILKNSTSAFGVITSIFSWIAVITVILAAIGIYGVIARSVVARTAEIGIRMAIGASASSIVGIFTRQALIYIVIGVGIGGLLGLVTVKGLSQAIFGIESMLPLILLCVAGVVGGLVLIASYVPAFRVVQTEPGDALRYE
jgi:putative ABC transport system permease protein